MPLRITTPFQYTPLIWSEQAKLISPGGSPAADWYGRDVAVSADGNTVIVGAYLNDALGAALHIF